MNSLVPDLQSQDGERVDPRQFAMIDVVATVTLVALAAAMVAPAVRLMRSGDQTRFWAITILQLVVAIGAVVVAVRTRKKLLARLGTRICIGYCGTIRWKHWPSIKSSVVMALLAGTQLAIGILATGSLGGTRNPSVFVYLYSLQMSAFAGFAYARHLWRVYPGGVEFFEKGVALRGVTPLGWDQVDLRQSHLFPDRMIAVIRSIAESTGAETKVVQLPDGARQQIVTARETFLRANET